VYIDIKYTHASHFARRAICMSPLCYEHDIRPSVCPSVTLVDCDHNSATKSGNGHMAG